jgi:L-alanine-DL-glutamate epimerase-like enolase superfamily enzyme
MRIESVEVRAVGEEHGWNFYDDDTSLRSTLTICRIRTECGAEGVGGVTQYGTHAFDATTATHLMRHLAPKLLGRDPLMREELMCSLASDVYPTAPHATAAVDIALWDLMGNVSGQPLYALLGGSRSELPVQWSSPGFETVQEYLDWCDEALSNGCRRIKIHGFMNFERDKVLVTAVKQHVDAFLEQQQEQQLKQQTSSAAAAAKTAAKTSAADAGAVCVEKAYLSLDVESLYSFDDAKRMAALLAELDFDWFEAPLPDRDFGL